MEQVNPLPRPRGTTYRFLGTFPPIEATKLDVQDWIRTWFLGSEYRTRVHQGFREGIKFIPTLQLTGRTLRLTPEALKQSIIDVFGLLVVAEPFSKGVLMARELEVENIKERVSTTDIGFHGESEN
jgi:hypothetical protein